MTFGEIKLKLVFSHTFGTVKKSPTHLCILVLIKPDFKIQIDGRSPLRRPSNEYKSPNLRHVFSVELILTINLGTDQSKKLQFIP